MATHYICVVNGPGVFILEASVQNSITASFMPLPSGPKGQGLRPNSSRTKLQVCVLNAYFLGLHYICFYYNI
ncbi:hypothetical protein I79_002314 [Cricetulus griseus]|uniref:Uncharacterized protein n=1 Tax=Cricetulus griseus TaxID=10029 RepID=G3GX27_CRIGR|nr:hypothetical protein I79_002314 [Cricetulus griseus]